MLKHLLLCAALTTPALAGGIIEFAIRIRHAGGGASDADPCNRSGEG